MNALVVVLGFAVVGVSPPVEPPSYERDIRPILAKRCTVCHGRENLEKPDLSAGLGIDTYEAALNGTKKHPVIFAGKGSASPLYQRLIDPDDERRMPLDDEPLTEFQQVLIRPLDRRGGAAGSG